MTTSHLTKKKQPLIWVMMGVLLLMMGVLLGRCTATNTADDKKANDASQTNQATEQEVVMAVEAIRPSAGVISQSIKASGAIAGKDVASVGTRMSGVAVIEVRAKEGQWVRAGEVLAVLDNQAARQDVVAAEARLHTAQAALTKATSDLNRVQPLIAIDAISREQYEGYQTAKIQAQSDVTAATASLNNARIHQGNSQVVAPVSGIISQKNAEVGMMATGAALFEIIKGGVLEWQASVPAKNANQLRIGQVVRLQMGVDNVNADTNANASVSARGDVVGVVERISPVANASRELTVHATLTAKNSENVAVVAGMFVTGEIMVGEGAAMMIPIKVVSRNDGYDYVWTLSQTDTPNIYTANQTRITITARQAELVAVDLPADTLIVKTGGNFLNHGDRVRLVANEPSSANVPADATDMQ